MAWQWSDPATELRGRRGQGRGAERGRGTTRGRRRCRVSRPQPRFGDAPAVLAWQVGQQAQHELPGSTAGLHPGEPDPPSARRAGLPLSGFITGEGALRAPVMCRARRIAASTASLPLSTKNSESRPGGQHVAQQLGAAYHAGPRSAVRGTQPTMSGSRGQVKRPGASADLPDGVADLDESGAPDAPSRARRTAPT